MLASILISSHNRLPLLRRCLFSLQQEIAEGELQNEVEIVVADDGSDQDILGELEKYTFPWKFVKVDNEKFTREVEKECGEIHRHYFNSPAHTNNVAFANSCGRYVILMGNEIIATEGILKNILQSARMIELDENMDFIILPTTYDFKADRYGIDEYGGNITTNHIDNASHWPLASLNYHSDVTNYFSLVKRTTWEKLKGYDERYINGIGAEDSDFIRRLRKLPNNYTLRLGPEKGITLHQYHGGKTMYYEPKHDVVSKEKWDEGIKKNRVYWNVEPESYEAGHSWESGHYGILEVISNECISNRS